MDKNDGTPTSIETAARASALVSDVTERLDRLALKGHGTVWSDDACQAMKDASFEISQLRARVDRLRAQPAWRPIESAEKGDNFVRILGAGMFGAHPIVEIIVWGFTWSTREVDAGGGLYRKEQYRKNPGWRRYGTTGEIPLDWEPTHWQPLPHPIQVGEIRVRAQGPRPFDHN